MVKIALKISATLENIEEFKPADEDFRWYLKYICTSCGENVSEKWNYASLSESTPAPRGNVVHHFVIKCKLCSRENSMTIIEDSVKSYTEEDQGKLKTIVVMDCRGLEPKEFSPRDGWVAKASNGGKTFDEVDLSDGTWADYCDKINLPVGIYDIEHSFERIK